MVKKQSMRVLRDIILLLLTLAFAFFLVSSIVKSIISAQQPFISGQGELAEDTNNYLLKPSEAGSIYDGLDLPQYIEGQYTVLALGMDEDELNTDVMMLFVFDLNAAKINILQIPRDCYVGFDYTNSSAGKINSVYSQGVASGTPINKTVGCVRDLFGIPIDSYIAINCKNIPPVVDAIGGIPINVPEDVIYEAGKIIRAGEQTLSGEQSEWFVRFRHDYLQGDLGRIKAQRVFLAAAMQKVKDMGTLKILKVYPTLKEYIMSDLDMSEIGKLSDFAQTVSMDDISVRMVPGEDLIPGEVNEYYGYTIHEQQTVDMLNEFYRPYQENMTANDLKINEVKNTTSYYDNDGNTFEEIADGRAPAVPRNPEDNE